MTDSARYRPPYPRIPSEGLRGRDDHPYLPDDGLIAAANAALALQMPLLLTGEAGCGKTDFAFAVAGALAKDPLSDGGDGELLECYVRSDSRARDLLYHYDAIRRFGDAQHSGEAGRQRAEEPRNYIRLQPLGRALVSRPLRVVLIDEIDKAPRDLPNDLLREIDQGHFEIPEIPNGSKEQPPVNPDEPNSFQNQMKRPDPKRRPMLIITSNVERQLPDPFLRRCIFFHIPFPSDKRLKEIIESRFPLSEAEPAFLDRVLNIFVALREVPSLTKRPTTSELINWVEAMLTVFDSSAVGTALTGFTAGQDPSKRPKELPWRDLAWKSLPAFGCLVKLREDLDRLPDPV